MAVCELCQRGPRTGYNVSFSKRHTNRTWQTNVQRATIYDGGKGRQIYICTRCLRTRTKTKE